MKHIDPPKSQRKQRLQTITYLTLILSVILIVFILVNRQHRQLRMAEAEGAVQTLFVDDRYQYLRPDIDQKRLDKVKTQVKPLKNGRGHELHTIVKLAEEKYQALNVLNQWFKGNTPILSGSQVQVEGQELANDLTLAQVEQAEQTLSFSNEDEATQLIRQLMDRVQADLQTVTQIQNQLASLPQQVEASDLTKDIQTFEQVTASLASTTFIGQDHPVYQQLQAVGEAFTKALQANDDAYQVLAQDSALTERLFQIHTLAKLLVGSELDPRLLVALTFDDGPHESVTYRILDILDQYQVPAAFFQLGLHVEQYPEITKEVVERGYQVGNHSYQHPNFDELDDASIQQEINKTQDLIEAASGVRPNMYRPPYGNGKGKMDRLFPELLPVFWNVDSEDWLSRDSQAVIDHVLATIKPRAIILMHDIYDSTADALPTLIQALKDQGYQFVTPDKIPDADSYHL